MDPFAIKDPDFWKQQQSFLLENGCMTPLDCVPFPAVVFFTSGSTGKPRKIVLSKASLLCSAAAVNAHLQVDRASVWGLCLPCWHVGGFAIAARLMLAECGMAVWQGRWQAQAVCQWLAAEGVTHLSLVPTQVHDLVQQGLRAPATLRAVVVGGGRLDRALGQRARDLGWPVLASYGMTEAGSQIATQPLAALAQSYDCAEMSILPCWEVTTDDAQQLSIRGPALFAGTIDCGPTGEYFVARAGEWYRTQDCGEARQGTLQILSRADDLVKVLGELVSPQKLESLLVNLGLPVGQFAILALADARKEHRLVLVHENIDTAALAQILVIYQQQVAGFERLDEVKCVDCFPRSSLGKTLRQQLKLLIS